MIYFIYPYDATTKFLLDIPEYLIRNNGSENIHLIKMDASNESYLDVFKQIEKIPNNSIVVFMGHGQEDKLWGAESEFYEKQPFVVKSQAKIFGNKYLFLFSCNSNDFLRGTYNYSKVLSSIGFGSLPTEMAEVENSKRLLKQGVTEGAIEKYRNALVELVSISFSYMISNNLTFQEFTQYFKLILNKKISEVILIDTNNSENRIVSNLLFQTKQEMVFI